MTHGENGRYEVVLGSAANRVVLGLQRPARRRLAQALCTELYKGPNAEHEIQFDSDVGTYPVRPGDNVYTATPLSFGAYTAIHRPLTEAELGRLRRELGSTTRTWGFFVVDILAAEAAFIRGPRVVPHG
jgi:hypothetical protein